MIDTPMLLAVHLNTVLNLEVFKYISKNALGFTFLLTEHVSRKSNKCHRMSKAGFTMLICNSILCEGLQEEGS